MYSVFANQVSDRYSLLINYNNNWDTYYQHLKLKVNEGLMIFSYCIESFFNHINLQDRKRPWIEIILHDILHGMPEALSSSPGKNLTFHHLWHWLPNIDSHYQDISWVYSSCIFLTEDIEFKGKFLSEGNMSQVIQVCES